MRRPRALIALGLALVALALTLAACGGGDDEDPATSPTPTEAPNGDAAPPNPSALPPGIAECLADEGYELADPAELHSVPEQALEACFNALHQGG